MLVAEGWVALLPSIDYAFVGDNWMFVVEPWFATDFLRSSGFFSGEYTTGCGWGFGSIFGSGFGYCFTCEVFDTSINPKPKVSWIQDWLTGYYLIYVIFYCYCYLIYYGFFSVAFFSFSFSLIIYCIFLFLKFFMTLYQSRARFLFSKVKSHSTFTFYFFSLIIINLMKSSFVPVGSLTIDTYMLAASFLGFGISVTKGSYLGSLM